MQLLIKDAKLLQRLQKSLKNVVDLEKILSKFARTAAGNKNATNLDDMYQVWRCLQCSVELVEIMSSSKAANPESSSRSSSSTAKPESDSTKSQAVLTNLLITPLTGWCFPTEKAKNPH